MLSGMGFSSISAQSELPSFAFDSYDKWGYCYQGTDFVLPCYDNVVDLGPSRAAFWAQQDSVWGLRRKDNSEIIPFVFDDVCVASCYQQSSLPLTLDSIVMFDRGVILPAVTLERDYRYRSPLEVPLFFPLLPVKKEGKWGYVDFKGNTVIPFQYDEAFIFTRWLKGDKQRANWLAEVRKGGKSAWIDIFGEIIIPWQQSKAFKYKEAKSYLKKRKSNETKRYDRQITFLANRMDSLLVAVDYVNRFTQEIKIVEVKPKKKGARVKPRYRILYADDTPVVQDTVDFVFEREGDALRVRTGGKMRAIDLNSGWLPFNAYDSIAPFDKKGRALAWSGKREYRIGLYGTCSQSNHSLSKYLTEIQSATRQGEWEEAAKAASNFSAVMPYYGSLWYRYACDATIRKVARNYNYYCDPKLIAERERIKAEKEAKKSESGWSILGDLLSSVGSLSKSSTSQSLKALGESIKSVAEPNETVSETEEQSTSNAETSIVTTDVSQLQAQINAIDQNLEQISNRQVQLARERLKVNEQVRSAGVLGAKTSTGSNLTRNFSASKTRQRAQQRANAQVSTRNRQSSIDTQLNQLKDQKAALLSKKAQLNKQIKQLTDASNYDSGSQSSSSAKSPEQKKPVNLSIYHSSQQQLNSIGRQLSELHTKYQDRTQVFSSSDRSRVKSLQTEAKQVRKNCLEQTGQTLPANSLENWNP